ncbi:MAG: exodeoxyribonuclease III [SAR324 cluster bacterium]|nr:exodeoxyribonuclease III [SAR324 cluster bacterium]MBL7036033.1 exodeoxyribonuclease III [SAR324 cluster bacterium]
MRIISANLNGIRSADSKGFFAWLQKQKADLVCLQETRIQPEQLTETMLKPEGLNSAFEFAEKRGYSGVGLYFNKTPDRVQEGIGWSELDKEGRFIQADFGKLSIVSLYLPSGSSGDLRQNFKYEVLEYFEKWLIAAKQSGREVIICGDWNIAHKEIDLRNWKSNQKNSGFLPEEREWMTKIFSEIGYQDVFRKLNQDPDQYTWWSNRGRSWAKNVGWRLDYQIATPEIAATARTESIYKDERFSDHAPLIIDYEYQL